MSTEHAVGDRVRWNFWTDKRESGWRYGTIKSGPILCSGVLVYEVRHEAGYATLMAACLLEPNQEAVGAGEPHEAAKDAEGDVGSK